MRPVTIAILDARNHYILEQLQTGGCDVRQRNDAEFIAHAREDVPYLLSEVAALSSQLDAAHQERDELKKLHTRGGTSDAVGRQDLPRRNSGDSSAPVPDDPDVQLLAWAVVNCHMLARRALALSTSTFDREKWENVLRICEEAGARSQGVLRASVPREITDGASAPSCPSCGHLHQGESMAFICIGCPCDKKPPFRKLAL